MGKKAYVIQSIGYEYNDEYNYRPECGGGHATAVYFDEVAAKKRMVELEIEQWKEETLGHYGYGDDIIEDAEEFESALELMGIDPDDWWDSGIPTGATDEQIKNLIRATNIRFYEIVEVDAEDYPTVPDSEFEPTKEMLDLHESMYSKKKKTGGIFDAVNEFTSPIVAPTQVPDNVSVEDIKKVVAETNDNFLEIKDEMKRLRDEARVKVKNFFLRGMNKIFEMYPEVKSVSWRQYTPYFNDGEECTFSAHISDFGVNGYDDYSDEGEEGAINVLAYDYKNGRQYTYYRGKEIHDAISDFLDQLDDDDYKTMFGDHAFVIVRKDEVIVEEYDHD